MRLFFTTFLMLAVAVNAAAAVENGKTYRIMPDGNDKSSLFVKNASKADKTPVVVWTETNVPAQQWTIVSLEGETVALKNVYTGLYLDTKDNMLVQNMLPAAWNLDAGDEGDNEYIMRQNGFLGVTGTNDGQQPS